jgi:TolB-like protein/tetratricopeptide (TPR) repeat protein
VSDSSFLKELQKRKVLQSAAIYGAIAWGVTEVLVTIVEQLYLPPWISTLAVIFFVVGFPVAMFLAWTFDFTTEGIHRTSVTSRRGAASIVASIALLIAGTTGLFFLIKPGIQERIIAADSTSVPIQPNSLAVLPFVNAGVRAEDAYLVEGLSDALRDQFGRVSGLRIAARSSSVAAVEQGLDALTTSSRLGVANLVEGTVRRERNVLLVSVQLINGSTGLADWSQTFERGPRELLAVQQAIAEVVVARMLPESEVEVAEPATRDPTANELMILARHYEQQVRERQEVDEGALLEAIRLYREAAEADPESALAQSRLAGSLIYMGDLDAAEAPIFKALSINPNLSEVQNTLGEFHFARGLTKEASVAWARAVELNPNNPEALQNYARWRWHQHEFEGVHEMYRRAVELDPLSLEPYAALGAFLAMESHYDEAYQLLVRVEELFDGAPAYRVIADIYEYLGDVDLSIVWTIRARDLEPGNPNHVARLAEFFADIGDHETAVRLDPNAIGILFKARRFEEMIDIAEFAMIDQPHDLMLRALLAIAYNATGQYESAIHVLSTTGLPDSVFNGWRSRTEMLGYAALKNALYAIGQVEMARKLARFAVEEIGYTDGYNWWLTITKACELAVLGDDEGTRNSLKRAQKGLHLVWDPVLKDAPCFGRFADDPVYKATVRYFDDRRAMLRERLPATLAEFGVEL